MATSTHNGEKHETDADEQEHGHPKEPKRIRRWALLVVVLSVAVLVWGCVFHGGLTRGPASFHVTNDTVVAVRLGSEWSTVAEDLWYNDYDGRIVLLDADGRGQAAVVSNVFRDDMLWNEWGVFYGLPSHDFLTTEAGTQGFERRCRSNDGRQRHALSDGTLAIVNDEGFGFVVGTVHADGCVMRTRNEKTGGAVGQHGSRIPAITDTKQSPGISAAVFATYVARSGDEKSPTTLAIVVQLDDHDGEEFPALTVAPMIDGLGSRQHMFACGGDVIMMLAELSDEVATPSHGSTSEWQ